MTEQTLFTQFVDTCRALESTTKRTEKVTYLVKFLKSINPSEVVPAVCFLIGRPFPESDSRVLDIGGQTIWKINRHSGQSTLAPKPVTILEVYDTFDKIIKGDPYFGSVIGRYANRIAKGKFTLDGIEYHLTQNDGVNCVGGPRLVHSRQMAWMALMTNSDAPAPSAAM